MAGSRTAGRQEGMALEQSWRNLHVETTTKGPRGTRRTGNGVGFETSSNNPTLPNPSRTVLPSEAQALEYMSLWRRHHSNHHSTYPDCTFIQPSLLGYPPSPMGSF